MLIAFPLRLWLHQRPPVLRCTCIGCLLRFYGDE